MCGELSDLPFSPTSQQTGMSLSRLANVELQLIMRCCDLKLLLALARCNRFALHCASSDFAFASLSPYSLVVSSAVLRTPSLVSASLLRFCDLALNFPKPHATEYGLQVADVDAIAQLPRIRSLSTAGCRINLPIFHKLLSMSAFCRIQKLLLGVLVYADDSAATSLAQNYLQLMSLKINCAKTLPLLEAVPRLPNLTQLHVTESSVVNRGSIDQLSAIGGCQCLKKLTLIGCQGGYWSFWNPKLKSLRQLTFIGAMARHSNGPDHLPSPVDLDFVFAPLSGLTSLRLHGCWDVDPILAAASRHCPALCEVVVSSDALAPALDQASVAEKYGSRVASFDVIDKLMLACPLCRFTFQLSVTAILKDYLWDSEANNPGWNQYSEDIRARIRADPKRYNVLVAKFDGDIQ
jgi:hypothetical protein